VRTVDSDPTFVRLCSVPALVTALPLLTRAVLFRWRVPTTALIGLSYVAMALVYVNVRFGLVPQIVRWLISAATAFRSAGYGISTYSILRDYVRVVTDLFAAQALGAQLAVVLLLSTMTRRAPFEAWRWPILRLLGLSGSALLVGVGLTPPDPLSQSLFTLPLIALFVLATVAGRAFNRSRPTARDAQRGLKPESN